MTVEFVDELPAALCQRNDWKGIRDQLRAAPGRWAVVHVAKSRSMASANAQLMRNYTPGFEANARHIDGEFRVYARYVGEP